jgi:hypothetical protein
MLKLKKNDLVDFSKGHSDYWTFELLGFRTIGLSDYWDFGLSDYWAFGLSGIRTIGLSDYRAFGLLGLRTIGPSDYWADTDNSQSSNVFIIFLMSSQLELSAVLHD